MESLLNRYRNITVLLLVIMAQLVLLAVSAKNPDDVRFIRIWTVTAVTPVARILEGLRGGGNGFLHNYILLHDTNQENKRLQTELDKLKMENVYLKNELSTADRAKALQVFQQHTQSRSVAATIIANGAGSNSKVVFVDRGTFSGVQRGMAVVTPDGIVGKVIAAYPSASQVLLITDPEFAAGVITEKGQVHGTLKGMGQPQCRVDYIPFEEKVEPGEWIYTSGDDRIFPRGFRVGIVKAVRPGQPFKEVLVEPSGMQRGLVEDVLILIEGVHERIPDAPTGLQPIYLATPPPGTDSKPADTAAPGGLGTGTEADRLRQQYQTLGVEQKHTYGDNPPGAKPMDFTKLGNPGGAGQQAAPGRNPSAPAGAPPDPAAGNTAPASPPVVRNPSTTPAPGKNPTAPATQTDPGAAGAAPVVRNPAATRVDPSNPAVGKNPPAAPPKNAAPAKNGAPATAPPKNQEPPAAGARRGNQAAGTLSGGPPR